jgi:hypothetical protein
MHFFAAGGAKSCNPAPFFGKKPRRGKHAKNEFSRGWRESGSSCFCLHFSDWRPDRPRGMTGSGLCQKNGGRKIRTRFLPLTKLPKGWLTRLRSLSAKAQKEKHG